jgi:uncharacterized protein YjcR
MASVFVSVGIFQPVPDWFRLLADLSRAGINNAKVAVILGVSPSTVHAWKEGRASPRHHLGEALKALHAKYADMQKTENTQS